MNGRHELREASVGCARAPVAHALASRDRQTGQPARAHSRVEAHVRGRQLAAVAGIRGRRPLEPLDVPLAPERPASARRAPPAVLLRAAPAEQEVRRARAGPSAPAAERPAGHRPERGLDTLCRLRDRVRPERRRRAPSRLQAHGAERIEGLLAHAQRGRRRRAGAGPDPPQHVRRLGSPERHGPAHHREPGRLARTRRHPAAQRRSQARQMAPCGGRQHVPEDRALRAVADADPHALRRGQASRVPRRDRDRGRAVHDRRQRQQRPRHRGLDHAAVVRPCAVGQRVPVHVAEVGRQIHLDRTAALVERLIRDPADRRRRVVDRQHRHRDRRRVPQAATVRGDVGERVGPVEVALRRVHHDPARDEARRPVRRRRDRPDVQAVALRIRVVGEHVDRHGLVLGRHHLVVRRLGRLVHVGHLDLDLRPRLAPEPVERAHHELEPVRFRLEVLTRADVPHHPVQRAHREAPPVAGHDLVGQRVPVRVQGRHAAKIGGALPAVHVLGQKEEVQRLPERRGAVHDLDLDRGGRPAAAPVGDLDADRHRPEFVQSLPDRHGLVGGSLETALRRAPAVGERVAVRVRRPRLQPHLAAARHRARIARGRHLGKLVHVRHRDHHPRVVVLPEIVPHTHGQLEQVRLRLVVLARTDVGHHAVPRSDRKAVAVPGHEFVRQRVPVRVLGRDRPENGRVLPAVHVLRQLELVDRLPERGREVEHLDLDHGRRRAAASVGDLDADRRRPEFVRGRPARHGLAGIRQAAPRRAPGVGQRIAVRVRGRRFEPDHAAARHRARIAGGRHPGTLVLVGHLDEHRRRIVRPEIVPHAHRKLEQVRLRLVVLARTDVTDHPVQRPHRESLRVAEHDGVPHLVAVRILGRHRAEFDGPPPAVQILGQQEPVGCLPELRPGVGDLDLDRGRRGAAPSVGDLDEDREAPQVGRGRPSRG